MKLLVFIFFVAIGCRALASPSEAKLPISITQFVDKSEQSERCGYGWSYWHQRLGSAFREMLVTELIDVPQIEILERETIRQIYDDEHNLINSEKNSKSLRKGEFKKAKLTLVGSVSEFEYCAEGDSMGVDLGAVATLFGAPNPVGSVKVGIKSATAKAVIDLRVIDVETGKIIMSVEKEGSSVAKGTSINLNFFDKKNESSQPIAKAAREAIRKAAEQLKPFLLSRI